MTITLYELAGNDPARLFSPYCWRTRMALAHKGLEFRSVPWRFSDKHAIAFSGQGRVPVMRDGERVVFDSWTIACDLEDRYPDKPSLFGGAGGRAMARFVNNWADHVLNPAMLRFVLTDIYDVLAPQDRDYFRKSREERLGMPLEKVVEGRHGALEAFRKSLAPVRVTLGTQPFLGGDSPSYADYIVFGSFQWTRVTSAFPLLASDDAVFAWRERMLDLYGGLGRKTPART